MWSEFFHKEDISIIDDTLERTFLNKSSEDFTTYFSYFSIIMILFYSNVNKKIWDFHFLSGSFHAFTQISPNTS